MDGMRNIVPKSAEQRTILEQELASERANLTQSTDPEQKQLHARNIIALTRTLAGKSTDFAPSDEENPDYVAQVQGQGSAPAPAKAKGFQFVGGDGISKAVARPGPGFKFVGVDEDTNPLDSMPEPTGPQTLLQPAGRKVGETPEGAATGISAPRIGRGVDNPATPNPAAARFGLEAGGATLGGGIGARFGPYGSMAGAAAGGFTGSLLSEAFDPTDHPLVTGLEAGAAAATGELAGAAVGGTLRHLIGKPNEAGEWLLTAAEKAGHVPPPGAVIPDSSLIRIIEGIAAADNYTGEKIKTMLVKTNGVMTDELRNYVVSYMRTKMEATRAFKAWDAVVENTLGNAGIVNINRSTVDALIPLIKGWEELGLISKVDNGLVKKVKRAQSLIDEGLSVRGINLSMGESEAARTLLYRASMNASKSTTTAKKAVGADDYATAYRAFGEDVASSMDTAIGKAVLDGRLPADARATLQGARNLWTKWKQGEAVMDELMLPLQSAQREGGPLKANDIYSAMDRLDKQGAKIGHPVVSKDQTQILTGIARAMEQAENAGKSKAFTWVVRAGQLGLIAGGGWMGGATGLAAGAVLSLTPAAFAWVLTNPKAASLIIRGMQMEPGTQQAMRLGRQLTTMGIKAGVFPPDQQYKDEETEDTAHDLNRLVPQ